MATIVCASCENGTTILSVVNYTGTVQCEDCGIILKVVIQDGIVADVRLNVEGGPDIAGLPKDVEEAYNEARRCIGVKGFTAVELLCRKILMHVAVEKGAPQGETFVFLCIIP